MKKFKVGDKVRYINNDGFLPLNSIHTITQIDKGDDVPYFLSNSRWVSELEITRAENLSSSKVK